MSKAYKNLSPLDVLKVRVGQLNEGIAKRIKRKNELELEIRELEIQRDAFEEAMEILAERNDG